MGGLTALVAANEIHERYADRAADGFNLWQLQLPLAGFVFADEALWGSESGGKLHLSERRFLANGPEKNLKFSPITR